jgi:hypothetical protein
MKPLSFLNRTVPLSTLRCIAIKLDGIGQNLIESNKGYNADAVRNHGIPSFPLLSCVKNAGCCIPEKVVIRERFRGHQLSKESVEISLTSLGAHAISLGENELKNQGLSPMPNPFTAGGQQRESKPDHTSKNENEPPFTQSCRVFSR